MPSISKEHLKKFVENKQPIYYHMHFVVFIFLQNTLYLTQYIQNVISSICNQY